MAAAAAPAAAEEEEDSEAPECDEDRWTEADPCWALELELEEPLELLEELLEPGAGRGLGMASWRAWPNSRAARVWVRNRAMRAFRRSVRSTALTCNGWERKQNVRRGEDGGKKWKKIDCWGTSNVHLDVSWGLSATKLARDRDILENTLAKWGCNSQPRS